MRAIEKIVTNDGVEHANEREARKYCNERLGEYLTKHAHALCQIDKYSACVDYLESNLESLFIAYEWQREAASPVDRS